MSTNKERMLSVILAPHISEKSTKLAEKSNQFTFKVAPCSTKREIKDAIEYVFDVSVDSVTCCNVKGKRKIFRQKQHGKRKDWKKAYVAIGKGKSINLEDIK